LNERPDVTQLVKKGLPAGYEQAMTSTLVAITGSDGAGKSSVVEALVERLAPRAARVIDRWDILRPEIHPQCGFIGASREELRAQMAQMPVAARSLFLFWTFGMMLDGQLDTADEIVLSDGYWMKHAAAEVAYGADRAWIEAMGRTLPRPQLTLLLDIDPSVALARKQRLVPYECGMDPRATPEAFVRHQAAVRAILLDWAKVEDWVCIDASEPLAKVVDRLTGAIDGLALSRSPRTLERGSACW
jgi:dTMP kinase